MIKYRGPFDTQAEAEAYVESVAGQGVPFRGYERHAVPSRLARPPRIEAREVVFAVYDDPRADWPDEYPEFDQAGHRWTVARPNRPNSTPEA